MSTQLETAPATQTAWTLDPDHTLVEFSAKHMMITTVKGRFREVTGTVRLDEANPNDSEVDVEIGAASIDTGVEMRDAHLRSADFLEVDRHPYLRYRSRRVEGTFRMPGDRFRIVGDLTIRGVTREVPLEVTYEGRGIEPSGTERRSFSAEARIDRRDFGLLWNSALETGGVLVGNEVKISLEVQVRRE